MEFIKSLRSKSEFNVFSNEYSIEKIEENLEKEELSQKEKNIGYATAIFHNYYKRYHGMIEECIKRTQQGTELLCREIMKISNRDAFMAEQCLNKAIKGKKILGIGDINSFTIAQSNGNKNNLNLIQVIEGTTDICNTLFNIFKRYNLDNENIKSSFFDNLCVCMYQNANLLFVLKDAYNTLIWEDGYIEEKGNSIVVKYSDEMFPIVKKIGEDRMMANELGRILEWENEETFLGIQYKRACISCDAGYIVDSVSKRYGDMNYSLKRGNYSLYDNELYTAAIAQIEIYYAYFTEERFESLAGLSLLDIIAILAKIENLLYAFYKELKVVDHINNFEFRIKKKELKNYLRSVTIYSKNQINKVVDLFVCKMSDNSGINLWKTPLFELGEYVYFLRATIAAPNIVVMMDYWLERAGYKLEERGKTFEKYIRNEIKDILSAKRYFFHIAEQKKFYNQQGQSQEIDLFINLKDIAIIVEIKCMKYPLESREYNNRLKTLKKASIQVKKKKEFIVDNLNDLQKYTKNIKNKKLTGVVITNLTLFTGLTIEGVPIIDYNLFKSYFTTAGLGEIFAKRGMVKEYYELYYQNEQDMCLKLPLFLKCPLPVKKKLGQYSLVKDIVTMKNEEITVYKEFVEKINN